MVTVPVFQGRGLGTVGRGLGIDRKSLGSPQRAALKRM